MQFKLPLILLAIATVASAQNSGSTASTGVGAAAPGAGAGAGAGGNQMASVIASLPQCFTLCATNASTNSAVGCKGITDFDCICKKPTFLNVTMACITSSGQADCKTVSKNTTALGQGEMVFSNLCKQVVAAGGAGGASAGGAGAGMNMSEAGMAGMTGMDNTSMTTGTEASANGTSAGGAGGSASGGHSGASAQHVATATIVFSALLAGIATLL